MLKLNPAPLAQQPITSLACISDRQFVSGTADGIVQVWNVVDDEATATSTYKNPAINASIKFLQVLSEENEGVVCKNCVVIGYATGTIEVLDITNKVPERLPELMTSKSELINLVLLSHGRLIAGYRDGCIHLWNLNLIHVGSGSGGRTPSICKLRNAQNELIGEITAFTALGDRFSAADHLGNSYIWELPNLHKAAIDLHQIKHIVTVKSAQSRAIKSLMLLSRSNLHLMSVNASGIMEHWKVREKFVGGFAASLDATTNLGEAAAFSLVNARNLPKWITTFDRTVQEWGLPVKITSQSQASAAAEASMPLVQNDPVPPSRFSSAWLKRQVANAVERPTDSILGMCQTFESDVIACVFLSDNLLVVAAGVQGFYLWWPKEERGLSSVQRKEIGLMRCSVPQVEVGEEIQLLGRGSFGKVYKANLMPANQIAVAVKEIPMFDERGLKQEIELHIQLSHQNILSLYGVFGNDVQYSLVCELMEGGTLSALLHDNPSELSRKKRYEIALDAAAAISYLHLLNICHRDVKSENFLVNSWGRIKLADFGTARVMNGRPLDRTNIEGTLLYMAPELVELFLGGERQVSALREIDVYAFAIVLWEIMMRQGLPYQMNDEKARVILEEKETATADNKWCELIKPVVQMWSDEDKELKSIDAAIALLKSQAVLSESQEDNLNMLLSSRKGKLQEKQRWHNSYVQYFVLSGQRPKIDVAAVPAEFEALIRRSWSEDPAHRPSIKVIYEELTRQMQFFTAQEKQKRDIVSELQRKIGPPKG